MLLGARILEAASSDGLSWRVVVIEAGLSLNGRRYLESDLREHARAFEGRPVKAFPVVDVAGNVLGRNHLAPDAMVGRATGNTIGILTDVRWSEAHRGLVGTVRLLDTPLGNDYARLFRALEAKGHLGVIGFSIDVLGRARADGSRVPEVVNSLDVVDNPAAGGRMLERIVASLDFGGSPVKYAHILAALTAAAPLLAQGYTADPKDEVAVARHAMKRTKESKEAAGELAKLIAKENEAQDAVVKRMTESTDPVALLNDVMAALGTLRKDVRATESAPPATPPATPLATPPHPSEERLRALEAIEGRRLFAAHLRAAATAAKLPGKVVDRLVESHAEDVGDAAAAQRIVESVRATIDAAFADSTDVTRIVREPRNRYVEALSHVWAPQQFKAPAEGLPVAFRNPIRMLESMLPGGLRVRECVAAGKSGLRRLKEAIDATIFDDIFDDTLDRVIQPAYQGATQYGEWRQLVAMKPYNDFRTHRLITIGYYGNLPTVAKGAPYLALTTPTDREETIALAKKGGIEQVTMEDLLNDDTGELWPTMIKRIVQAANETRHEAVFGKLRISGQPTMVDGYALTSASRPVANLLTTALTANAAGKTAFIAAVKQMLAQTGGSGVKKGIRPGFLVIPLDLIEAAAYVINELSAGNSGTDVNQALKEILGIALPKVVIDYGTGSATDWFLLAKPQDAEVLVMGTLGGRDGPEVFLADDQRFSSLFTNDVLEVKVRDIFAVSAADYAGVQGNDV